MLHLVEKRYRDAVAAGPTPEASEEPILGFVGPIEGSRALIVGSTRPNLLCALLRGGCSAAATVRAATPVVDPGYDLLFAFDVTTAADVAELLRIARRALVPAGRLVADIDGGLSAHVLRGQLTQAGFSAIRTRDRVSGYLIRADHSVFGWSAAPIRHRCWA